MQATPAAVDLDGLLSDLVADYRPQAEFKGLAMRLVPTRLKVFADPTLLERALRNLIENAVRYTPAGSILLGVRRRQDRVRLDVVDTGVGIAEDKKEEIFEEFVQVGNPGRDLSQGLGLGLAIVARLAALTGATIEVDLKAGRGSRFSLWLPRAEAATPAPVAREVRDAAGGRLLIIEDNAILSQTLDDIVREWGYDTVIAASSCEALERAATAGWRFEGIVSDHRLGAGLTGVDTVKEISRRAGRSYPTLILTGDTAKERITEITSSGFAVLHKPVDADALRQKLAELMPG